MSTPELPATAPGPGTGGDLPPAEDPAGRGAVAALPSRPSDQGPAAAPANRRPLPPRARAPAKPRSRWDAWALTAGILAVAVLDVLDVLEVGAAIRSPSSPPTLVLVVVALLPVLVAALVVLYLSAYSFRPYEQGLVLGLGGKRRAPLGPGLHWVNPTARVVRVDTRTRVLGVSSLELLTRDQVPVQVDAAVYFRVADAGAAVLGVRDFRRATVALVPGALRQLLGETDLAGTSSALEELQTHARDLVGREAEAWGVHVERVELRRIDPGPRVRRALSAVRANQAWQQASTLRAEAEKAARVLAAAAASRAALEEQKAAEAAARASVLKAEAEARGRVVEAEGARRAAEEELAAAEATHQAAVLRAETDARTRAATAEGARKAAEADLAAAEAAQKVALLAVESEQKAAILRAEAEQRARLLRAEGWKRVALEAQAAAEAWQVSAVALAEAEGKAHLLAAQADHEAASEEEMAEDLRRRAELLRADAERRALILRAEGKRQEVLLEAEGRRQAGLLLALGESQRLRVMAIGASALEIPTPPVLSELTRSLVEASALPEPSVQEPGAPGSPGPWVKGEDESAQATAAEGAGTALAAGAAAPTSPSVVLGEGANLSGKILATGDVNVTVAGGGAVGAAPVIVPVLPAMGSADTKIMATGDVSITYGPGAGTPYAPPTGPQKACTRCGTLNPVEGTSCLQCHAVFAYVPPFPVPAAGSPGAVQVYPWRPVAPPPAWKDNLPSRPNLVWRALAHLRQAQAAAVVWGVFAFLLMAYALDQLALPAGTCTTLVPLVSCAMLGTAGPELGWLLVFVYALGWLIVDLLVALAVPTWSRWSEQGHFHFAEADVGAWAGLSLLFGVLLSPFLFRVRGDLDRVIMTCPRCFFVNPPTYKLCASCGQELHQVDPRTEARLIPPDPPGTPPAKARKVLSPAERLARRHTTLRWGGTITAGAIVLIVVVATLAYLPVQTIRETSELGCNGLWNAAGANDLPASVQVSVTWSAPASNDTAWLSVYQGPPEPSGLAYHGLGAGGSGTFSSLGGIVDYYCSVSGPGAHTPDQISFTLSYPAPLG